MAASLSLALNAMSTKKFVLSKVKAKAYLFDRVFCVDSRYESQPCVCTSLFAFSARALFNYLPIYLCHSVMMSLLTLCPSNISKVFTLLKHDKLTIMSTSL